MFCRNCGKELIGVPDYCLNCGARPLDGTSLCPSCANPTTPLSEICVKCGMRLIQSAPVAIPQKPTKNKTTSILLAVFLHFWTWAYTYKRDSWKFWVGLGIWLFMIMTLIANIGPFGWLIAVGVWVWAIIDAAGKPEEWYGNYQ